MRYEVQTTLPTSASCIHSAYVVQVDSDAYNNALQATQQSLSKFTSQATSDIAYTCSCTQSLEKQVEQRTQNMHSKLSQHAEVRCNCLELATESS